MTLEYNHSGGICRQFKLELLTAGHDFSADTIKMALYDANQAAFTVTETVYSTTNEVTGTNYTAGGIALTVSTGYPALDAVSGAAQVRFDDAVFPSVTLTAQRALIYNQSKSNRAIAFINFGALQTVTAKTFTVKIPTTAQPIVSIL